MEKSLPSEYTKRLDRLVIKAREVMFNARSPSIIERLYIKAKDIGSEVSEISEEGSLLAAGYFLDRVGRYFGQGGELLAKVYAKRYF